VIAPIASTKPSAVGLSPRARTRKITFTADAIAKAKLFTALVIAIERITRCRAT
jgi:hypothetical protein